jgi:membrane protein DedA with SNARE-associated domain
MSFLGTFHGTLATVVLCVLLFAEESGVPLPLVPGDVLLVYAGILIASGGLSPWLFIPLAVAAATGGALLGYSWTRLLGAPGLRALAGRLGMAARLERLERRVRSSGPAGLLVARHWVRSVQPAGQATAGIPTGPGANGVAAVKTANSSTRTSLGSCARATSCQVRPTRP